MMQEEKEQKAAFRERAETLLAVKKSLALIGASV